MPSWVDATKAAIMRHVAQTGSPIFTRQGLESAELDAIVGETGTAGITPGQTLGRELQQLRDAGLVEFVERGSYRWLGAVPEPEPVVPSNAVFVLERSTAASGLPQESYGFASKWLRAARNTVGQWIVYQDDGCYRAAARVERIDIDRDAANRYRARIAPDAMPYGGKKKGADGGIDGLIYFKPDGRRTEKAIVSVKGGDNTGVQMIRDLHFTMERERAPMGVFITRAPPTGAMEREAAAVGRFHSEVTGKSYARLQILTLAEMFQGKRPDIPYVDPGAAFRQASREPVETQAALF